eukprot:1217015-Rhodomonas_salina.1
MLLCAVRYWRSVCCYALCGTGVAYAAELIQAVCYIVCGTETTYDPTECAVLTEAMLLPAPRPPRVACPGTSPLPSLHTLSSTDLAYPYAFTPPDVQY